MPYGCIVGKNNVMPNNALESDQFDAAPPRD